MAAVWVDDRSLYRLLRAAVQLLEEIGQGDSLRCDGIGAPGRTFQGLATPNCLLCLTVALEFLKRLEFPAPSSSAHTFRGCGTSVLRSRTSWLAVATYLVPSCPSAGLDSQTLAVGSLGHWRPAAVGLISGQKSPRKWVAVTSVSARRQLSSA